MSMIARWLVAVMVATVLVSAGCHRHKAVKHVPPKPSKYSTPSKPSTSTSTSADPAPVE